MRKKSEKCVTKTSQSIYLLTKGRWPQALLNHLSKVDTLPKWPLEVKYQVQKYRVEICRDRRSCKICANCVILPGEQHDFSQNLRRTTRFTRLLVCKTFGLKIGSCKFFEKSQVCKNTIRDEAALRNKLFTLLTLFTLWTLVTYDMAKKQGTKSRS